MGDRRPANPLPLERSHTIPSPLRGGEGKGGGEKGRQTGKRRTVIARRLPRHFQCLATGSGNLE